MPNASSCRCSSGRSPIAACRRGRSRPMAAMPARIISRQPRRAASLMSPSTRSAAWRSKTWSRAAGFIASCATSAPGSRPGFPASSEPTVWHAAPGAGSIISRPTSGPRWWRTTWCCSPASNRHRPRLRPATSMTSAKSNQLVHPRSSNDSFGLRHYFKANTVSLPDNHRMPRPSKLPKNVRLWTGTRLILCPALRFAILWRHVAGDAVDDWVRWLVIEIAVATTTLAFFGEAWGSGFQIRENSAAALGNAFAGAATSSEDPSIIANNPAGMIGLSGNQVSGDFAIIIPSAVFSGMGLTAARQPISGGNGGDAVGAQPVPAAYGFYDASPDLKVGLALTAPFGLQTQYQSDWVGRYQAIRSDIATININPNVAYRVSDWFSIGGGPAIQHAGAEFTNAINSTTAVHLA